MDLAKIKEVQTSEYELLHPTDRTKLGVIFTLAGPEHPTRRNLTTSWARDLRKRVNRTGKVTLDDPETDYERETDFLVGCVLGWRGLTMDGAEVPYNAEAARRIFTDHDYAWLRRQVQEALNQTELFISSSSGV